MNYKNYRVGYLMGNNGIVGGHRIVYEHLNRLRRLGIETSAIYINEFDSPKWFDHDKQVRFYDYHDRDSWIDQVDMVVATFNETFWFMEDLPEKVARGYFVQTDERNFYDNSRRGRRLATETYSYDHVFYFTEATWIKNFLKEEFGQEACLVRNKISEDHFYPDVLPDKPKDKTIVLVEGNVHTPKKGVQDAAAALDKIDNPQVEKWLMTNALGELPEFVKSFDKVFQSPPQDMVRKVYSTADMLIKPSYFEGSPMPHIEAMCCGTALITTDCTGIDEYCVNEENCLVVGIGKVNEIKAATERLIADQELRQKLVDNGLKLAREVLYDWDSEIKHLADCMASYLDEYQKQPLLPVSKTEFDKAAYDEKYDKHQRSLHMRAVRKLKRMLFS